MQLLSLLHLLVYWSFCPSVHLRLEGTLVVDWALKTNYLFTRFPLYSVDVVDWAQSANYLTNLVVSLTLSPSVCPRISFSLSLCSLSHSFTIPISLPSQCVLHEVEVSQPLLIATRNSGSGCRRVWLRNVMKTRALRKVSASLNHSNATASEATHTQNKAKVLTAEKKKRGRKETKASL